MMFSTSKPWNLVKGPTGYSQQIVWLDPRKLDTVDDWMLGRHHPFEISPYQTPKPQVVTIPLQHCRVMIPVPKTERWTWHEFDETKENHPNIPGMGWIVFEDSEFVASLERLGVRVAEAGTERFMNWFRGFSEKQQEDWLYGRVGKPNTAGLPFFPRIRPCLGTETDHDSSATLYRQRGAGSRTALHSAIDVRDSDPTGIAIVVTGVLVKYQHFIGDGIPTVDVIPVLEAVPCKS